LEWLTKRAKIKPDHRRDFSQQPQNSLPDVIIWMISGSTRIAYDRIPAYQVMFSPREEACGKYCGKTIEIEMKVIHLFRILLTYFNDAFYMFFFILSKS